MFLTGKNGWKSVSGAGLKVEFAVAGVKKEGVSPLFDVRFL